MAIAQRVFENTGRYDEGTIDLHRISAIFQTAPSLLPLRLRIHFNTIEARVDPDNLIMAANIDGEWYVGLAAFIVFTRWDGQKITVRVPGCNAVVIPNGQPYKRGIAGFQEGFNYVKLSALGLNATLQGDTLEIG